MRLGYSRYSSDYRDYASQLRLRYYLACGHYPKMTGSPCAACCDRMIEEAQRSARGER